MRLEEEDEALRDRINELEDKVDAQALELALLKESLVVN